MSIRFGTDGVRGVANVEITPELALALGAATATVFGARRVVVGRDTRRSGPMLEAATAAGIAAVGADAVVSGVAPTPAVAHASARGDVPGIVISASHNPFADNGLKVFAPGGRKLSDDQQAAIEDELARALSNHRATGAAIGTVTSDDVLGPYADQVVAAVEGRRLDGLHVVLDCAHGANSQVAPEVFRRLGAVVEVIGAEPDGTNINDGVGSTDPAALCTAVLGAGADLGIAFDGDADRMLAVGPDGTAVTGDHLLALFAADLRTRDRLRHGAVVVTVMTNLGFHRAMADAGISVVTTPVGDRSVLEALAAGDLSLGGEQSGHLVFADLATTGDGLLAGVLLADLVRRSDEPLDRMARAAMVDVPQLLLNVAIDRPVPDIADWLSEDLAREAAALGDEGRVLVRPSGTEPVVRVMVEATDAELAAAVAERLADAVRRAAGA